MAVLCPSFEVAANALQGIGTQMNQHLLQTITHRFADLARPIRVECHADEVWQKPGLNILVCVDGGRLRERRKKRGKRKTGQKRQGFYSDWIEPRLLSISLFDENGKKIKSISPILDGSCGSMDEFFELLKQHLKNINLGEASQIVFCSDNGPGIWSRTKKLIDDLNMHQAKCIIDYTHAKQNIGTVVSTIERALKVAGKEADKLSSLIKNSLWNGNIAEIVELAKRKLSRKRKARKTVLKKLGRYFGDHSKFQYKVFADKGLPIGSGSIESAIRRVINLRVKSAGMFWKREHAENVIFLRSLVLTGKLRNACRTACNIMKRKYYYCSEEDVRMAA
jgi:hypothetical protein